MRDCYCLSLYCIEVTETKLALTWAKRELNWPSNKQVSASGLQGHWTKNLRATRHSQYTFSYLPVIIFLWSQHFPHHRNIAPSSCNTHINQPWAPRPKIPGKDCDWPNYRSIKLISWMVYCDWLHLGEVPVLDQWLWSGKWGCIKSWKPPPIHKIEIRQEMFSDFREVPMTKDACEVGYEDSGWQEPETQLHPAQTIKVARSWNRVV